MSREPFDFDFLFPLLLEELFDEELSEEVPVFCELLLLLEDLDEEELSDTEFSVRLL